MPKLRKTQLFHILLFFVFSTLHYCCCLALLIFANNMYMRRDIQLFLYFRYCVKLCFVFASSTRSCVLQWKIPKSCFCFCCPLRLSKQREKTCKTVRHRGIFWLAIKSGVMFFYSLCYVILVLSLCSFLRTWPCARSFANFCLCAVAAAC